MIMVKRESKARQLYASGLCFREVTRIVEKYWEAGLSSVCIIYYAIGHKRIGSCEDRPPKYIICTCPYKVEEHCCLDRLY